MADILEGTDAFNAHHARVTGEIPITVHDGGDGMTPAMVTSYRDPVRTIPSRPADERPVATVGAAEHEVETLDDFASAMEIIDANPIVVCDTSNPEVCESCM